MEKVLNNSSFVPQSQGETCWAATFANALSCSEKSITDLCCKSDAISKSDLDPILSKLGQQHNKIIEYNWQNITNVIDGDVIIVYYFPIIGRPDSHFVNIYGYGENDLGKWFYIYDPKPDTKGSCYVLNYEQFVKSLTVGVEEDPLRGIIYFGKLIPVSLLSKKISNISGNLSTSQVMNLNRPRIKPNINTQSFQQTNSLLKNNINILIEDKNDTITPYFKSLIGLPEKIERDTIITFKEFLLLPLRYPDSVIEGYDPTFQIIRNNYTTSIFIPLINKNSPLKFLTGLTQSTRENGANNDYFDSIFNITFLNSLVSNEKSFIDHIIDIMKIRKKKPNIVYLENEQVVNIDVEDMEIIHFPIERIITTPIFDIRLKDIINVKTNSLSNMDNVSLDAMKEQVEMNVEQLNNLDKIISNEKLQKMDERIKGIPRE